MFFTPADVVYVATVYTLSLLGFSANCFLLFLIIYKSPKNLSPYRIFLADTTITNMLSDVVFATICPRVLSASGFRMVVIYLGPIQFLHPFYSYLLYSAMLHLTLNSYISWMISMIYRYLVLRFFNGRSVTVALMCIAGYMMPFSIMVATMYIKTSANVTEADVLTHHSIPNMTMYSLVVTCYMLQLPTLYILFCSVVLPIPIYVIMYICRWKTHSLLTNIQSLHTRQQVRELVQALTAQSLVPLFSIFPPATVYLLILFGLLDIHLLSYMIVPCLSIGPLLDPLITIYYVHPFRKYVENKSIISIQQM
ncbi:hypothetical protein KIN20_002565 [Parelaphostrongylus tenuis]|uniref:G-protein coupled receptors family 1 profile domain-containing protein n=1 Tax=Parelaphostrongylus tenuis TaxID=148309 RepID=A0AAD5LYR1_PARTN|nr:hypothetical protein KIN20_002565 [Parelaphostrongylus tenuis]